MGSSEPRGAKLAPLTARVRASLRSRGLIGRGARVLVACSGGPDSVVMTDALVSLAPELGLSLVVASVDHGLRPESAQEVLLVRALAHGWGVPFHGLRLELSRGPGVQARAREARYAALHQLRQELGADLLAVGHTRDDQAETVLARLLRGSGVRGLRGIWPARADGVVRPLIDCTREDVLAHVALRSAANGAGENGIAGRQASNVLATVADPSNDDHAYERVRLRRETLPVLRAEDPEVTRHLAELADDAHDLVELVEQVGAELLAAALCPAAVHGAAGDKPAQRAVQVSVLREASRAARREALRQLVATACTPAPAVRRAHLLELEQAVLGSTGAHVLVGHGVAYRRVGDQLHEFGGSSGRDNDSGGLRLGSEETTKLYV